MKKLFSFFGYFFFLKGIVFCQEYAVGYRNDDGFATAYKSMPVKAGDNKKTENRYGLINSNGKFILPMVYRAIYSSGEDGIYQVKDTLDYMALYNAVSQRFITDAVYFDIKRFSEGLAMIEKKIFSPFGFYWGAVDKKGNIVIPFEYKYLGSLKEGLINFKKESKMGYMDRNMKVVIPETYYNYADFSNGLAVASPVEGGKKGFINKNNNMVIPPSYEEAFGFNKGYAIVELKKSQRPGRGSQSKTIPAEMQIINKQGKPVTNATYHSISTCNTGGLFVVSRNDKKGVIDSTGIVILPLEYKDAETDNNGNIIFRNAADKYGMINNKGAIIMKPEYDYIASPLYEKMYYKQNGRVAIMDKNRKIIVPADSAVNFVRGRSRILFIYNDKVKVFDNNGKLLKTYQGVKIKPYSTGFAYGEDSLKIDHETIVEIINPGTGGKTQISGTEASDFNEAGIFLVKNVSSKYDFYDYTGKKLNPVSFYSAVNFSEGICATQLTSKFLPELADKNFKKINYVTTNFQGPYSEGLAYATNPQLGKIYYLDKLGNEVFSLNAKEGSRCKDGLISVKDNYNKYYLINKTGKEISEKRWDGIGGFSDGLALVKENLKWGFIDTQGNTVIDTKYDEASSFTKATAIVKQNGKFFLINKKGEPVNGINYDAAGNPDNGTFPVQKNNLTGLIDSKGNIIIDFKQNYSSLLYMTEDRVWASKDGKWGLLDNTGKALTEFIFDGANYFKNGYAVVMQNGKYGVINKAGRFVVPAAYKSLGSVYKNSILGIRPAQTVYYTLK